MSNLFITILNMSVVSSYVALIIILCRLILKKAPKFISYGLWTILLFRLICPFSFESNFSLLLIETSPIKVNVANSFDTGMDNNTNSDFVLNEAFDNSIDKESEMPMDLRTSSTIEPKSLSANRLIEIGSYIWSIVFLLFFCYTFLSYFVLKRRLSDSIKIKENIYKTDRIVSPFVLGIIKPKIYIPCNITETELTFVLLHEQAHIKRKDHAIKAIFFLITCLHWFNPIIWLSYHLFVKDMEMSCDESVVRNSSTDIRKEYSQSLLSLSIAKSGLLVPLSFGENSVKSRIKNILKYKRLPLGITLSIFIIVLVVAVSLFFNPLSNPISNIVKQDGNPAYTSNARYSEEGVESDYIYAFSDGEINPLENEPILMLNGKFCAEAQTIDYGGKRFLPLDSVVKAFGGKVLLKDADSLLEYQLNDVVISAPIGEYDVPREIRINGEKSKVQYLYENNQLYFMVASVSDFFELDWGYYPGKELPNSISYNPCIWIDYPVSQKTVEKAQNASLEMITDTLMKNLEELSERGLYSVYGRYEDMEEQFQEIVPEIKEDILNIKYFGMAGRYALYQGPGSKTMLVDTDNNEIYYYVPNYLMGAIVKFEGYEESSALFLAHYILG